MTHKVLIIAALTFVAVAASAQPQYDRRDSVKVTELLKAAAQQPPRDSHILFFARQLRGIPYVAHTLERNDRERLVVNLRELDCTTYVENVLALDLCIRQGEPSFDAFCRNLQRLRYRRGGEPSYTARLHYFTTWIEDNTEMGFCREIQSPNPPFTAVQKVSVDYMTRNIEKYKMLAADRSRVDGIREMERHTSGRTYRYIPKAQLKNTSLLRRTIKDGDIIAIITNKKGLDTQHIGIAVWHSDGLHLLNASSIHKKVVEEPMTLRQYLEKHKTMPGIRVVRMK